MPNKKINQLDSRVIAATDLMLVGDPSTGVSFKSLVSGLGGIYVPNSRTLTVNGTTYDLSANRTWNVGTVTSVNMSVPTGLTISGNPITSSGTLALALASGYTIPTQALLDGKVPYIGATGNVDLGEYELKTGQLTLDVSPTGIAAVGTTRWNNTIGSTETTLKGGTVILKNGVDLVARVVNKVSPNATLTKAAYQAVRVTGAQGQRLAVAYAQANNDNNSADTIGLVCETIATNQEGFIITVGQLENINTTGSLQGETWNDGDVLYLSPTTPGAITNVKPAAPQHLVVIGYVEYAHANNGKIYVKVMNGWELGELHDVNTTGAVNGNVLKYNGSIWVPSSDIDTGITSLNGLTALSQTFATGTTGTDFNIGSAGSTHTFNIPSASATNRGALTSADWTIFNGKENVLTFNSPLSRSTNTISIPVATTSVNGYLSSTDWNIFNNKQNALTNPITGTGNVNQVAFFNSLSTITSESNLYWDATNNKLGIQNTNPIALNVNGSDLVIGDGSPTNKGLTIFGGTDGSIFFADNASTYAGYIQYGHSIDTFTFGTNNIPRMTLSGAGLSIGASNAIVDTDKFLVLDAGVVKYRTGAEVLSDIGGQASGNYITALTGEVTASGPGSAAATLLNSAVIGKVLTGLNLTGGGTISATDTILQAFGKTQNQISALVGGVMYEGVWNANTNSPAIVSGVGNKGDYYVVNVAGSTNIDGISDWKVGDWIIFNGTNWDKVDNTDAVSSVNGFTGAVNLTTANISEVTNLYFTDARVMSAMLTGYTIGSNTAITFNDSVLTAFGKAQAQINTKQNIITLTTTGSSGSATLVSDTLNIPTYTLSGLGGQPQLNGTGFVKATGTTISYDNSTYALDSAVVKLTGNQTIGGTKTFNGINFVVANGTTSGSIDFGTSLQKGSIGYSDSIPGFIFNNAAPALAGIEIFQFQHENSNVFSITKSGLAYFINDVTATKFIKSGGTSTQYLMADGSTSTLTNPVTGTGTTNYLPKWTSGSALGNSQIYDDGISFVGVGTTSPVVKLDINGSINLPSGYNLTWGGAYAANIPTIVGVSGASGYIAIYPGGSTSLEKLRITSTGNLLLNSVVDNGNLLQVNGDGYFNGSLGVGTISPAGKLTVADSVNNGTANVLYLSNTSQTGVTSAAINFINIDGVIKSSIIGAVYGNDYMTFNVGSNTERMRISASGNLGLGVVPSAWSGNWKAIQLNGGSLFSYLTSEIHVGQNFYNSTSAISNYLSNGYATDYWQYNGQHIWMTAPSGTAGNAITFTQAMTLTASGRLLLGTTTEGTYLLDVNGTGRFSGLVRIDGQYLQIVNATNPSLYLSNTVVQWQIKNNSSNNLVFNDGAADRITFAYGGAATFSSSVTATSGVFNGVATYNLKVQNGASANTLVEIHSFGTEAAGENATLRFKSAATSLNEYAKASIAFRNNGTGYGRGDLYFNVNNDATSTNVALSDSKLIITSGGNLLVGTSTDSGYKLDVGGTGRFTGNVTSGTQFYVVAAPPATNGGLINVRDTVTATNVTSFAGVFFNSSPGNDYSIGKLTENNAGFLQIRNANSGAELLRINAAGAATFSSTIQTAAPTGGTARPWKLGQFNSSVDLPATGYVEVEINGVFYKLLATT